MVDCITCVTCTIILMYMYIVMASQHLIFTMNNNSNLITFQTYYVTINAIILILTWLGPGLGRLQFETSSVQKK